MACLSLAVKMEERKIPALTEFQMGDYIFESWAIQRMEILVLNTLEWRMSSVTPFAYLTYFISKFTDESRPKSLLPRAIGLISDTIKGKLAGTDQSPNLSILFWQKHYLNLLFSMKCSDEFDESSLICDSCSRRFGVI